MKRGVSNLVFIFLFALILMALILAFGIKSFMKVKATADLVELLTFEENLNEAVQQYYSFDAGSSAEKTFAVPSKITSVCFFDPRQPVTSGGLDPTLAFFLRENKKDTFYTLPLDAFPNPAPDFLIEHVTVDVSTNPLCISTQRKLTLFLETIVRTNNIFVQVKRASS
jgi:type II secretory pathway pseudopilin PulG